MKTVFADANYWIALINPRDDLRDRAISATPRSEGVRLVTTDWVLVEVLNYFADKGAAVRLTAARTCDSIRNDPNVEVVPALRSDLDAATASTLTRSGVRSTVIH